MKIRSSVMALIIFLVVFGGIGAAMALGVWATTSDKQPAKYKDGAFAGQANPADIRGSYTFADISSSFGIEASALLKAFAIPADTAPAAIKSKDLESRYPDTGIGNESMQIFVALYLNLPIDLDDAMLPDAAIPVITAANPKLTAEQKAWLESHTIATGQNAAASSAAGSATGSTTPAASAPVSAASTGTASSASTGTVSSAQASEPATTAKPTSETEPLVNGSATFQQLLDAGITRTQIEQVIGAPMPPTNQTVKDYCTSKGLTFSTVKNALNALVPVK